MFVSRWHRASRVDLWVSYQNISGSQDLHNSKPSSLIAQQLLLNINYVILLHFLISYGCAEHFFSCIWQSCQPSMSLCQLSAMSIGPTHLFGFCMLTSVDKMFIRFIFAKDMQLHYIWYYKNINKNLFLFIAVCIFWFLCGKWGLTWVFFRLSGFFWLIFFSFFPSFFFVCKNFLDRSCHLLRKPQDQRSLTPWFSVFT